MSRELVISGFILGVAFRSFFDLGFSFVLLLVFISLAISASGYFYNNFLGRGVKLQRYMLVILFMAVGIFWYDFRLPAVPAHSEQDGADTQVVRLENLSGKASVVRAVVVGEPEEKSGKLMSVVSVLDEKMLIKTSIVPKYRYGDTIQLIGEVKKPQNFSEDFDYVSYLAKDDIYFLMDNPRVSIISSGDNLGVSGNLFLIKNFLIQNINEVLPEPHSSLLAGLILGAKDSLGKEWVDKFRIAGLSHIVVLSGHNLTIISDAVMGVLKRFFSGSITTILGATAVILFAIMTGGGASTIRAAIMALVILLAKTTGRVYQASSALIVAGFLMVLHNPRVLVFDMSFQLSFLATLGILYISPYLKDKFTFITERLGLREVIATTIGAQIATSPLIVYKMGTFSLVALPVNILVLALIPLTMFVGFLSATLNIFSFYIATPFSSIAWILLSYILLITDLFSSFPSASVNVTAGSVFSGLIIIMMFVLVYKSRKIFASEIDEWKIEEI